MTLRLLLWLKWTLTWRGYRRSRAKVVSLILVVVFAVPVSVFFAWGVWSLLQDLPALGRPVARDALAAVSVLWVVTPLLGFSLNESFDLTRLFVYPVSLTRIFLGSLLGGLMDRSVLLVLPVLGVLLVHASPTPAAAAFSLALLLGFLLHTLALGQALMLLLVGLLRSRRFRDVTIVLFPLIGMGYYLGQRLLFGRLEAGTLDVAGVVTAPAWRAADWLPPGWAAGGLSAAARGDYGGAALALLALAAAGALAVGVAVTGLRTLYAGDAGPARPRPAAPDRRTPVARRGRGILPGEIGSVVWKEWTYFLREPQYKALAVQTAYTLLLLSASFVLPSLRRGGGWGGLPGLAAGDTLLLGVAGFLLLSLLPLLFNVWAGEGAAITVLFSLPTPRRALLLGKNVAHGLLALGACAVGLTAAAALSGDWRGLPVGAAWALLATPVLLAAGNLVSVRFPHRMLVRGQQWRRGGAALAGDDEGGGLAYSLLYALAYGATGLALLPVLAAVLVPGRWGVPALWYALSLPLAAAYSAALYLILLGQAEAWLLAREPEIVARIAPE